MMRDAYVRPWRFRIASRTFSTPLPCAFDSYGHHVCVWPMLEPVQEMFHVPVSSAPECHYSMAVNQQRPNLSRGHLAVFYFLPR
jgi:hypothetical protein